MCKLLIFFLVTLFIFIGCKSDSNSPDNNGDDTVTDIDGNIYQTVAIGDQVWMAENLKVRHYRNGAPIPNVTDSVTWISLTTGAYCEYDNDPLNVPTYGRLYNWYAVDDTRSLAPAGWHVPTDEEWKTLEIYLGIDSIEANNVGYRGTNQGSQLAGGGDLWTDGALASDSAFGTSGFAALPGGFRHGYRYFTAMASYAIFWLPTEYSSIIAWNRYIRFDGTGVYRNGSDKLDGFSVRCVRD